MIARTLTAVTGVTLLLAACGPSSQPKAEGPAIPPQEASPAPSPTLAGGLSPGAVNQAPFAAPPTDEARAPAVLRAQILLDRARFSPGVIDGTAGENLRQAVAAYEEANALPVDGEMDEQVFAKLTAVTLLLTATAQPVQGRPFPAGSFLGSRAVGRFGSLPYCVHRVISVFASSGSSACH